MDNCSYMLNDEFHCPNNIDNNLAAVTCSELLSKIKTKKCLLVQLSFSLFLHYTVGFTVGQVVGIGIGAISPFLLVCLFACPLLCREGYKQNGLCKTLIQLYLLLCCYLPLYIFCCCCCCCFCFMQCNDCLEKMIDDWFEDSDDD